MIKIEFIELLQEIERLATEYPEAVYSHVCKYNSGECGPSQGCLVGQAARNINRELFWEMVDADKKLGSCMFDELSSVSAVYKNPEIVEYILAIQLIQSKQDLKNTWGNALLSAKQKFPHLEWSTVS